MSAVQTTADLGRSAATRGRGAAWAHGLAGLTHALAWWLVLAVLIRPGAFNRWSAEIAWRLWWACRRA